MPGKFHIQLGRTSVPSLCSHNDWVYIAFRYISDEIENTVTLKVEFDKC